MFGFSPSVMQSKQRTCCVWKPEFLETKVHLNCGSVTWLCFTLNFTAVSHSQRAQRGIKDIRSPLGIFNLKYLSASFCFDQRGSCTSLCDSLVAVICDSGKNTEPEVHRAPGFCLICAVSGRLKILSGSLYG